MFSFTVTHGDGNCVGLIGLMKRKPIPAEPESQAMTPGFLVSETIDDVFNQRVGQNTFSEVNITRLLNYVIFEG